MTGTPFSADLAPEQRATYAEYIDDAECIDIFMALSLFDKTQVESLIATFTQTVTNCPLSDALDARVVDSFNTGYDMGRDHERTNWEEWIKQRPRA